MHVKDNDAYLDNKTVSYCDELEAALNKPQGGFGAHTDADKRWTSLKAGAAADGVNGAIGHSNGNGDVNDNDIAEEHKRDELHSVWLVSEPRTSTVARQIHQDIFQPVLPGQPQA